MKKENQKSQKDNSEDSMVDDKAQMSFFEQFKQQMLKAWLPIPTLTKTITLFFVMSAIFISIGIPMIILSNQIVQAKVRYDNQCTINSTCTLSFQINEQMANPVFVYYQLNGYYQNHRLYAKSVSQAQLSGSDLSVGDISEDCTPITLNSQLYVTKSINNVSLVLGEAANPCGMVAYTFFNDSFVLQKGGSNISITTDGIAWPSDVRKYKISNPDKQWLNVTDPRFMNWMRIATLPDFRKLWGRINADLSVGTYTVQITNSNHVFIQDYDLSTFGTTKYFVLSTSNFFGSKNTFLSILYLVMGVLCFFVAIAFLVKKLSKKAKEN